MTEQPNGGASLDYVKAKLAELGVPEDSIDIEGIAGNDQPHADRMLEACVLADELDDSLGGAGMFGGHPARLLADR